MRGSSRLSRQKKVNGSKRGNLFLTYTDFFPIILIKFLCYLAYYGGIFSPDPNLRELWIVNNNMPSHDQRVT